MFCCAPATWAAVFFALEGQQAVPSKPVATPKSSAPRLQKTSVVSEPASAREGCEQRLASKELAGSAGELGGDVLSVVVFISPPGERWSKRRKDKMLKALGSAEQWLAERSEEYGRELKFHRLSYGYGEDIKFSQPPPLSDLYKSDNWQLPLLRKLGGKAPRQWMLELKKKRDVDQVQVLIFSSTTGQSYATWTLPGDHPKYYAELAVIHEHHFGEREPSASILAHEILHLYGAWDLYKSDYRSQAQVARARELWPKDIMFKTYSGQGFYDLSVGPLSAWLIGWTDCHQGSFQAQRSSYPNPVEVSSKLDLKGKPQPRYRSGSIR
jgi:hypothetical protein